MQQIESLIFYVHSIFMSFNSRRLIELKEFQTEASKMIEGMVECFINY